MKKVLISGCSFTENATWPQILFYNHNIENLGKGAAGNMYISQSVMSRLLHQAYDFVFILYSGLHRIDIAFPKHCGSAEFQGLLYGGHTDDAFMVFSGGKNTSHHCYDNGLLDAYLKMQYSGPDEYITAQVSQSIMNCHNMLEKLEIDYQFSFIYNLFDPPLESPILGPKISKSTSYFKFLDWSRYIEITPLEFGIRYDLLDETHIHLTQHGMCVWAQEIKPLLRIKQ